MTTENKPFFWFLIGASLITALRALFLYTSDLDLFFDEAQYWSWSKNLDWGYYSKPPMIAWIIGTTTSICGNTESCIRLGSPIIHMLTSIVIYAIGHQLYNQKIGVLSGLTYLTLPAVTLSASLASTDAALLLFWSLTIWAFIQALESENIKWWILIGICAGLGLLSKYTMLAILFSVLVLIIINKKFRFLLNSPNFWASCIIALILFSPNILWNAENHFVSFLHTKDNIDASGTSSLSLKTFLEFFGGQFGVFGPILFATLLVIFCNIKKASKKHNHQFLLSFSLPLLAIVTLVSFISRAHANWAAPAYITATILVVAYLVENNKHKWVYASLILHIVAGIVFLQACSIIQLSGFTLSHKTFDINNRTIPDPYYRLRGWKTLGNKVTALKQHYPNAVLLTITRKTYAELLYYVSPHPFDMVKWQNTDQIHDHYELTANINDSSHKEFLLITSHDPLGHINGKFTSIKKLEDIIIPLYEGHQKQFFVYHLKGYKKHEKE